jgi:hypothetical protein
MIKEFRKPDLKAPRCRQQIHTVLNNKFIEEFTTKHPKYKDLKMSDIRKILNTFHGKLWDHALHNRDGVELPDSLGFVFIGTCFSPKKYNTDFGGSIKNEVTLRHRNFESDNFLAKIFYTNYANKYKFKNRELWNFSAIRDFKRGVAKVYPEKWKMYLQVESGKHITKYLKNARKNEWFKNTSENFVVDPLYNEFDIN